MSEEYLAYRDKNSEGNSEKHRSGKDCIDCGEPAGTVWSPYWCVDCNIRRMDRINQSFEEIAGWLKQEAS